MGSLSQSVGPPFEVQESFINGSDFLKDCLFRSNTFNRASLLGKSFKIS